MELKYTAVFIAGIILVIALVALCIFYRAKAMGKTSVKLANTDLMLEDNYYKKQLAVYGILRAVLIISVAIMILATAVLLARPYYIKKIKEQKYNRDIIICLDISSSVDELNLKLVKELQDTVRGLSGERIGIVIFNTTPVVLSPLTDDYEYTINQLENIRTALRSTTQSTALHGKDWLYWNEFLYGGTLIGNEIRGSSLIGDGLLGGLFAFPDNSEDRTKIIIFSTDNDPNGEGYVNLKEASEYCKKNQAIVYGIGTKSMYSKDLEEMKEAVEYTGGKFFLEEKASTFHEIVEEIEQKSENLTEGKTIIKFIESPERYFRILILGFTLFVIISVILKRGKTWWWLSSLAMAVLLIFVYVYAVLPAHQFSKGPDLEIKKKSNLNVVFIIDNTISMLAKDMPGGKPRAWASNEEEIFPANSVNLTDKIEAEGTRLYSAKKDACAIVNELEGAQFSVISFNNDAMILCPLSQDINHVKNAIKSIYPLETLYAKGSSLNTPKELAIETLKSIANTSPSDQKTAVFFISDGEITAEGEALSSYAELAPYIDGGAVMGYGTKQGGTMRVKNYYAGKYDDVEDTSDWPYKQAVSVIDEDNLKQIAKDLGIEYKNMTSNEFTSVIEGLKARAKVTEEKVERESGEEYIYPPKYYGFYFLIPFAILIIINSIYIIKER